MVCLFSSVPGFGSKLIRECNLLLVRTDMPCFAMKLIPSIDGVIVIT